MVSHFTKVLAICHEFFIFMIYPGNWATTQTNDYSVNRYNTTKRESPINSTLNSSLRTDDIPGARPRNLNFSPPRLTNKQFLNIDRPGQRANERRLSRQRSYDEPDIPFAAIVCWSELVSGVVRHAGQWAVQSGDADERAEDL
jgi:hypothetical protein